MSNDLNTALVRTLVPTIVGPLVARFAPGVDIKDPDTLLIVSAGASYVYYVAVRLLETKNPQLGYLLGVAKQPGYANESAPAPGPDEHLEVAVVPDGMEAPQAQGLKSPDAPRPPWQDARPQTTCPCCAGKLVQDEPEVETPAPVKPTSSVRVVPLNKVRATARAKQTLVPIEEIKKPPVKRVRKAVPPPVDGPEAPRPRPRQK